MNSEIQEFIANQFRAGKPLTEVLARGASQPPGQRWNRLDVQAVLDNEGMTLGPDGRLWVSPEPPPGRPGRKPVNPPKSSPAPVQPGQHVVIDSAPQRVEQLLRETAQHDVAKVRNLSWRITAMIETLRQEVEANSEETKIRRRLAELEAETKELKEKLAANKPKRKDSRSNKPINHGSWGGFQAHRKRNEDPCQECIDAKDEHMASLREKSPLNPKPEEQEPVNG